MARSATTSSLTSPSTVRIWPKVELFTSLPPLASLGTWEVVGGNLERALEVFYDRLMVNGFQPLARYNRGVREELHIGLESEFIEHPKVER